MLITYGYMLISPSFEAPALRLFVLIIRVRDFQIVDYKRNSAGVTAAAQLDVCQALVKLKAHDLQNIS